MVRYNQIVEAMRANSTTEVIEKFSQTTFQNESLKRKVSSKQLIILNEEHGHLCSILNFGLSELSVAKMPKIVHQINQRMKHRQELLFKKPEKKLRNLAHKTEAKVTPT